jgi:CRP/FNR family cyclic AMP-dependent transcriptional regulator
MQAVAGFRGIAPASTIARPVMPMRPATPLPPADPHPDVPMSPALRALAARGVTRRLRKGSVIIAEGEQGDTLFVVLEGRLRAFGADAEGNEVTYALYGPGEYVGEMSLDGGPRAASVEAERAALVAVVTRRTLEEHLREHPEFAFELLAKVIRRAREATHLAKQIALSDVYGRLKDLLEGLAVEREDGHRHVDPAPAHHEIARRIGCSRPMVSRVLKGLERGGYVRCGRRQIVLLRRLPAGF